MKILTVKQIRQLDQYTIENEPIDSYNLMERAASAFCNWFLHTFSDKNRTTYIFCGPGNNGGDGLAIGRILHDKGYHIRIYVCEITSGKSSDFEHMYKRARSNRMEIRSIRSVGDIPLIPARSIIIDGIFGSGLSRTVEGLAAKLIGKLNESNCLRIAIDIPSGMYADRMYEGVVFRADHTLSFQLFKLSFMMPECIEYTGRIHIGDIGLDQDFINKTDSIYHVLQKDEISRLLIRRKPSDHKGTFGHALLICGSIGSLGAALMAGKACLRSGAGLLTLHLPACGYPIAQASLPEAMVSIDPSYDCYSSLPDLGPYSAIGVGCGLDQKPETKVALESLLKEASQPLVLDADALNLVGKHPGMMQLLPKQSILTPHPKEFERLFGPSENGFDRLQLAIRIASEYKLIIVLKVHNTAIISPEGTVSFNSSGNPGMATGGSGDVLTGMITGLLAQGYKPLQAAMVGVFLHGIAGDLAAEEESQEAMIATDIIQKIGPSFNIIKSVPS